MHQDQEIFPLSQQELVEGYADMVKRIAYHLANRMPAHIKLDDLIQTGMLGLLEAADHYDPGQGASFKTYSSIRIRGKMLDELRQLDWTPRSVYRKGREVNEKIRQLEQQRGRAVQDAEVIGTLDMTGQDFHNVQRNCIVASMLNVDAIQADENDQPYQYPASEQLGPEQHLEREMLQQRLSDGIDKLPERERLVLSLYYEKQLNLKDIGLLLEVSESRVCQIHGQAIRRLRDLLALPAMH